MAEAGTREGRGRSKRTAWRVVELSLLTVGLLCLGLVTYWFVDARLFQYREERELDAALEAGPRAAVPAAYETDRLDTLKGTAAPAPVTLAEGALVGRIELPRLGVSTLVLQGVSPLTLRRGVGHIPGTSLPQEGGNVGLAGHRDTVFRALRDVRVGDTAVLKTPAGTWRYQVDWTRVVEPDEVSVLAASASPELTLVTCYPFYYIGSAPQRFIVRAHRLDEPSASAK
jgi:sortase A